MNKPTKATIFDLTSALQDMEHRARNTEGTAGKALDRAADSIRRALAQLTENKALLCGGPGCMTRKPTSRALAAHRAVCRAYRSGGPT